MNKNAKVALWLFIVFSLSILFLFMYFVFAASIITNADGTTSYNINEDVGFIYNITVNNTEGDNSNVSEINILLYGNLAFAATFINGTDASGAFAYNSTTNVLNWSASGLVMNGTWKNFWFNATASTPGDYNISVISYNGTGMAIQNISIHVNDTTAPVVTINSPANTTYSTSSITFNFSLNENGYCEYTLDGGATNYTMQNNANRNFNMTTSALPDTSYTAVAYCNDTAGNKNYTNSVTFGKDTTAPAAPTIVYPSAITYTVNVSALQYIVSADSASCWYSNNSGVWNSTSVDAGTNFTNMTSVEASNTWTLYCNDTVNNINSTSVTFTKDTVYPVVTLTLPLAQNYTSLSVNITLSEAGSCEYSLDAGANNVTLTNNGNVDFTGTNTSIADSNYTLTAYCNDTAGNNNYTVIGGFAIDNTSPFISYGAGTSSAGANLTVRNLYVNVSVTETNEKNITFYLWNSTGLFNATTFTDRTKTMNWTSLNDGSYTYNIEVRDAVNHVNTTQNYTAVLHLNAPIITVVSPSANTVYNTTSSMSFNVSLNEAGSWCGYSLNGAANISMTAINTTYFSLTNLTLRNNRLYNVTFACNDTAGNLNATLSLFNFTINDTLSPTVSALSVSVTSTTADITWTTNEYTNYSLIYWVSGSGTTTTSADLATSQTASLTSLSASTTYYFNVTAYDAAGNNLVNGSNSFTTSAAASSGSPGGSSGGTPNNNPNKTVTYSWTKITPGAATIWKLSDSTIGLKQISVTVNNPAQTVSISVTKYDGVPANVTKSKTGQVYRYLKITPKNLEQNLSKAVIRFQVEKSWLANKSLAKDKMSLFKFDTSAGDWKEISSAYKEEDTKYYYYDADLTSFSDFAIAEKVVTTAPTTPINATTPAATAPTPASTTPSTSPEPAEKSGGLSAGVWVAIMIGVIIALIAIIIGVQYYKRTERYFKKFYK